MEAIQAIVRTLPQGFMSGLLLNGSIMTLAYIFVWKIFRKPLQTHRIQLPARANPQQIQTELKNAMLMFLVGAFSSSVIVYLSTLGYTKIYINFDQYSPLWGLTSFFMIWVIDDAWFYWIHRLLHQKVLYRHIHGVHHRSIDVTPFSSMSFHAVEAFLLTFWIFPVSFVLPIFAPALGTFQIWGLLNNIKGHLGYELYPANFNRGWLRLLTTSTHHNMHHSKFKGNYGLHFRFWDQVCGTEFKDYETTFAQVKARKVLTVE